jgi:hypothetical protein
MGRLRRSNRLHPCRARLLVSLKNGAIYKGRLIPNFTLFHTCRCVRKFSNPQVAGSSPAEDASKIKMLADVSLL